MIISGIAIEPNTETRRNGRIKKVISEDELRKATPTLESSTVTRGNGRSVDNVIGEVIDSYYKDGVGVAYKIDIIDEWGIRVQEGKLSIAPRFIHDTVETDDEVAYVKNVKFETLFLCPASSKSVPGVGDWTVLSKSKDLSSHGT